MKPAYAKYSVSAHLHLVPVTQPFHLHLVHRVNLPFQALAAHFRAVVPHPSAAPAHAPVLPVRARLVRVLHLVLHPVAAHFRAPVALSHHRVHASHPLAQALHLAIQLLAQAAPAHLSLALALRAVAVLSVAPAHHLSAVHHHPVIQPSHHRAHLAAHPVALHLHLRVRASRYCKANTSILIVPKAAGLLRLWDLEPARMPAWIMA